MREEMFLMEEYLKTLRILMSAKKMPDCYWEKIESTSSAFVLRFARYEDMEKYFLQVFLRPAALGIYGLFPVSVKYRNEKIVPQAVLQIVEQPMKDGFLIVRMPDKVDEIDITRLESGDEARYEFVFWVMKWFSFEELETSNFNKLLSEFVFQAEKILDRIDMIYR